MRGSLRPRFLHRRVHHPLFKSLFHTAPTCSCFQKPKVIDSCHFGLLTSQRVYKAPSPPRPHYGKRGTERGIFFPSGFEEGKGRTCHDQPQREPRLPENQQGLSLNRPGMRGDPRRPSPLQQRGRVGVNRERLQDWSRRWLPPPPPTPRVADSSFLFGLTASTWRAPATILFLPPSPQAPGSPLSPPPHPQAAFPSVSFSPSPSCQWPPRSTPPTQPQARTLRCQ